MLIISSQWYRNDDIIAQKTYDSNLTIIVCPVVVDGKTYHILVDGHHTLTKYVIDGNSLSSLDIVVISPYNGDNIDSYWLDGDWYYINDSSIIDPSYRYTVWQ